MLLTVAIVSFTAYSIRDHYCVHHTYVRYTYCYINWANHSAMINDLIEASEKVAHAETESIWTSARAAENRHIERMNELRVDVLGCWGVISPRQSDELQAINENIRKYDLR